MLAIKTKFFYLIFTVIVTIGFFLTDIFVEPYIVGQYVLPSKPPDTQFGTEAIIAMFALPSAITSGILFGVMLGLWVTSRPGYKALYVGIVATILLVFFDWYSIKYSGVVVERYELHWGIKIVEAIIFVGVFILSSMGTSRLAVNVSTKIRKISGSIMLLAFFGVLLGLFCVRLSCSI